MCYYFFFLSSCSNIFFSFNRANVWWSVVPLSLSGGLWSYVSEGKYATKIIFHTFDIIFDYVLVILIYSKKIRCCSILNLFFFYHLFILLFLFRLGIISYFMSIAPYFQNMLTVIEERVFSIFSFFSSLLRIK